MALAVMAAGAHTMSIAAPALAEQDRLAREADAAAERAVVPTPAATDGLPVPALLGGIVLAFAVGLAGGHVQRRRRLVRRSAAAKARPAPAPTPSVPARPAPPPPEPVAPPEPKPVQIAASPPPPPPPPPVRATGPRILRFRPAPAPPPPEPDELVADEPRVAEPPAREPVAEPPEPEPAAEAPADEVAEPTPEPVAEAPADEIVEPAPADEVAEPAADEVAEPAPADEVVEPSPAAEPPRRPARGPEMPRRDQAPRQEPAATPLAHGPESVRHPRGKAQARPRPEAEPEVALPARRFARAHPWPRDAESLWTCEIAWKAGYLKSNFRAMAGPPGATRRKPLGESPSLRWTLMTDPEPPTPEMIASVKALVSALADAGWERAGQGNAWYALRFVWRRDGVPGTIAVRDATESAEPPTR